MNALYLLYDALIGINVPNERARAVVDALEQDMSQSLATKSDLQSLSVATKADLHAQTTILRAEMKTQAAELRSEMQTLASELRADMQSLATELRSDMQSLATELRSEMKAQAAYLRAEIQQLRHSIDDKLHRLTLTLATLMVTIMTAGIGLLVTLQRLP